MKCLRWYFINITTSRAKPFVAACDKFIYTENLVYLEEFVPPLILTTLSKT
jgi:hypothetical protein